MQNSPPERAPEIRGKDLTWFNVREPLTLTKLRGKLVVLDFWTFCCINCIQILPSLARVEETFAEEVVVIGVHSPKFLAERDPKNVAAAIARYGIQHPVVHDPDFTLWHDYGVRGWPTLVVISPRGDVIAHEYGEVDPDSLVQGIGNILKRWRGDGASAGKSISLVRPKQPDGRLLYPGKIKAVPGDKKNWAIANSGRNQILIVDDAGLEVVRYGTGEVGMRDGPAKSATFNGPQGLVATTDAIYVADTGNHAIRRIDLDTSEVKTLAGTRRRGMVLVNAEDGLSTALASPWDLEVVGRRLIFANAGTHQLGEIDLASGKVKRLAGSGIEGIVDGRADRAQLAQPSGLSLSPDNETIYFVDSETSSLRTVTLDERPTVSTLVGTGLFDFGHQNGALSQAVLQHPLGVATFENTIFIADSYNHMVRSVDLSIGQVSDFDDGQYMCADSLCIPLAEPAGVALAGPEQLFVVDTNNHRILRYDMRVKQYRTWVE